MLTVGTTMSAFQFGWDAQFRSESPQRASFGGHGWSRSIVSVREHLHSESTAIVLLLGPRAQTSQPPRWVRGRHGTFRTHRPGALRSCPGREVLQRRGLKAGLAPWSSRPQPLRPVPLSARRPPCRRGGGFGRREERRLGRHRYQHRAVRGESCRAGQQAAWSGSSTCSSTWRSSSSSCCCCCCCSACSSGSCGARRAAPKVPLRAAARRRGSPGLRVGSCEPPVAAASDRPAGESAASPGGERQGGTGTAPLHRVPWEGTGRARSAAPALPP